MYDSKSTIVSKDFDNMNNKFDIVDSPNKKII